MGRERIEVQVQAIAGEERNAARSQALSQGIDDAMCHVLGAGTELNHRKNLRARINRQPQPEDLCSAAELCWQFVQLEVWEVEMAEGSFVQRLSVLACPSKSPHNRGLSKTEDPFGGGRIEPFGQRREHHGDLVRWGFPKIQGSVALGSERGMAVLTTKHLDMLGTAMLAISHQCMHVRVGDAEVQVLLIETGEALCVHALGCSAPAFHLTPGAYSCRGWSRTWRRRAGETAERAVQ